MRRLTTLIGLVLTVVATTGLASSTQAAPAKQITATEQPSSAAPADVSVASTLWWCDVGGLKACTRVKSAPSSGVKVLDRSTGRVTTLYNGNSVFLNEWRIDSSRKCGVNGVPYVWLIGWKASGSFHYAWIGDYYLATGTPTDWRNFALPDGGNLYQLFNDDGGTGTCDRFPNG